MDKLDRSSAKKDPALLYGLVTLSVEIARLSFSDLTMNKADKHCLCVLLALCESHTTCKDALYVDQTMLNYSCAGAALSLNAQHISSATTAVCSMSAKSNDKS